MTVQDWLDKDRSDQVTWRGAKKPNPILYSGLVDMVNAITTPKGSMVEIGTLQGESTELFAIAFEQVYAVDPYGWGIWPGDGKTTAKDFEKRFVEKVMGVHPNITKMQMRSVEAAKQFEDESLDFVYIDGGHTYADAKEDILTWLPKVKHGRFFGGHDYVYIIPSVTGVIKAVDEIFGEKAVKFKDTSWLVFKE